jgi:hypothetical protein
MADTTSKNASDILEADNQNLQFILSKVKQISALNKQFQTHIDPNIAQLCQVANLQNGKLIIVAANGSIATQLRFESVNLLRKFKADPLLESIKQIEAKVRPSVDTAAAPEKKRGNVKPLAKNTAALVNDIADTLDDPRLKAVLKRIAGHSE